MPPKKLRKDDAKNFFTSPLSSNSTRPQSSSTLYAEEELTSSGDEDLDAIYRRRLEDISDDNERDLVAFFGESGDESEGQYDGIYEEGLNPGYDTEELEEFEWEEEKRLHGIGIY